jgi:hypothetical protein
MAAIMTIVGVIIAALTVVAPRGVIFGVAGGFAFAGVIWLVLYWIQGRNHA